MYPNDKIGDAIVAPNRNFNARLLVGDKVLVDSIKSFTITQGSEEITIGSAIAGYTQVTIEDTGISLSGKEVSLETGIEINGEMEYIPMGVYTIQNPKKETNKITFTAYDCLASKCNNAYFSELSYPADALDVLAEIETKAGITIDQANLQRGIPINQRAVIDEGYNEETEEDTVITTYVNPFDGYTFKEAIGFIAGLFGKIAVCGRTGKVEFRWYQDVSYNVPSSIFYNDLQETEESFAITRLTCSSTDKDLSSGSGVTGISMQNPVMTQDRLNSVYDAVKDLEYTPATLRFIGDPRLDIGDIVTAEKNDGSKFIIPIISLITSFDGGLMQTIASYGNTVEEDEADTKGPITEMAERVEYETALVKKLMAENFTATNATIKNLSGDVLNFKTGEFENLKSDIASFKEATTTNLNATNAKIENIEANTIKSDELEAKIAEIGYLTADEANIKYATITRLEAESAKIENLQSDYATFKTATADDLKAANANIQNLTATKATITDLDAAKANISILEGNYANLSTLVNGNLTSANIQSLILTSKNTTIENGMIKNAMIENLSFDKITGMDINTTNLTVHSSDGKSKWTDNTIQISDANRVRVQIGKDASNDYSMSVWDKDGNLIWDALGATEKTIQRKIIRDDVVAENANISGSKLDINSVVREVNGSTTKLKSSIINMDDKNQTLDVVFNELATTVDEIEVGGRNLMVRSTSSAGALLSDGSGAQRNGTSYPEADVTTDWIDVTGCTKLVLSLYDTFTDDICSGRYCEYDENKNCINTVAYNPRTPSSEIIELKANTKYIRITAISYTKYRYKLEKGNKATDWTPAPEDTESAIESNTTSIKVAQGKIETLLTSTSSLNDKYKTVTDKYNSISETVEGHTQTIGSHTSSLEGVSSKITTIEENINGITTRVSASEEKFDNLQIGGRNLIRLDGLGNWTATSYTYDKTTDTYTIVSPVGSSVWGYGLYVKRDDDYHKYVEVPYGKTYILSFEVKTPQDMSINIDVNCFAVSGGDWAGNDNDNTDNRKTSSYVIPANKWTKVWVCWENTAAANTNRVNLYDSSSIGLITSGCSAPITWQIRHVKGELGNTPTDWTPSPKDIDSRINSAETKAEQTAKKFSWLVKSGDSASNFELTDRTATLVAEKINLNGLVTFNGLDSATKDRVNTVTSGNLITVTPANPKSDFDDTAYETAIDDKNGQCIKWRSGCQPFLILTNYQPIIFSPGDKFYYDITVPNWDAKTYNTSLCIYLYGKNKKYKMDANSLITLYGNRWNNLTGYITIPSSYNLSDCYYYTIGITNTDRHEIGLRADSYIEKVNSYATTYAKKAVEWESKYGTNTNTMYNMVSNWANGAVSANTKINGGLIETNTILAQSIALGDFTNYSQLNHATANHFGFTTTDDFGGEWFTVKNMARDIYLNDDFYDCNPGDIFRIEFSISTSMKGNSTAGGTDSNYLGSTIGLYTYSADGSQSSIYYAQRITASANATETAVSTAVKVGVNRRKFRVFLQTESYGNWSGTIKIRNVTVRKMTAGNLIVDGAVSADKIATDAIKSRNYVANSTGSFLNLADGTFDSKYLKWDSSGNIAAKGGTIGKYKITDQWLITGSGSTATGIGGNQAFWAGSEDSNSAPFRVGYDGKLVASNTDISGKITATSGTIGRYEITDTCLKTGDGYASAGMGSLDRAFWAGGSSTSSANFYVEYDGNVYVSYLKCNDGNSDEYTLLNNGKLYIQADNTSSSLSAHGFEFEWSDYHLKSVSDGVECYRNLHATDFIASGYIYNSSGGHYTWNGKTSAFMSCGGNNNARNIYYYADAHCFYVNGDSNTGMMYIQTSGVTSRKGFTKTSDERIKKNFEKFDDNLINAYMDLNPVKYQLKDESTGKYHFGFKAQDVARTLKVYGQERDEEYDVCVSNPINPKTALSCYGENNMDTIYSLRYDEIVPLNTFMIQKNRKDLLYQAGKIDMHEAIINDLQFKIANMEKKIEQLTTKGA